MVARATWHAEAISLYGKDGWTYEALGAHFGVTREAVYRAVRRSATARGTPAKTPLTPSERMKRYRAKKQAQGLPHY